jgi:hypothetical protein
VRAELGLAALNVLVAGVGFALLYALRLARPQRGAVRLVGLAYLSGWALLGTVLSLALLVGIAPTVPAVTATAGVLVVAGVVAGRRRAPAGAPVPAARPRQKRLGLAVTAAGAVLIALAAFGALVGSRRRLWDAAADWDAVWFWIPKAEALYRRGLDAEVWGSLAHPEYPPLAPALNAAAFNFAGLHPSLVLAQSALLGVAFLLALLALLDRFVVPWLAFPSVALLATAPWFWSRLDSPLPDQTVAYLVAAAAVVLFLWLHEGSGAWLVLGGILLAAASLTKVEGAFFAVLLAVVVAGAGLILRGRVALPALALLLAPALLVPWKLWLSRHGLPSSSPDYQLGDLLRPGVLGDRSDRLTFALEAQGRDASRTVESAFDGSLLLAVPVLGALVLAATRVPALVAAMLAWAALAFAGLAAVYWIGAPEVGWYVSVTVDRVQPTIAIVVAALFPLVVGLALRLPAAAPSTAAARRPAAYRVARLVPAAAAAVLLAAVVATTRPATAGGFEVDAHAVEDELSDQFRLKLAADGYHYGVSTTCRSLTRASLSFVCHVGTINEVDPARQPSWDVTVACTPWGDSRTQRCVSSEGDALY